MELTFNTKPVYTTDNYKAFEFFSFNREVNKAHARNLSRLIKKNGFKGVIQVIKTNIVDGEERLYILDGQHRFTACKMAGVEFAFEITELNTRKEIADFITDVNTTAKGWSTNQFLNVWSEIRIKEYVKLKKVMKKNKLQISVLVDIYGHSRKLDAFRDGSLTFPDEAKSDTEIEQLLDLDLYLSSKAFCRRAIVDFMRDDRYDHKKVLAAIKNRIRIIGNFSEDEKTLREELFKLLK